MKQPKKINREKIILWAIYILLLAVLLPHTAWAFGKFEPDNTQGKWIATAGAIAFESMIAILTHKLAQHIDHTRRYKSIWKRYTARYFNAYAVGLLIAVMVSTLANLAHSVEFGGTLAIFAKYNIPFGVYAFSFGAILPLASLVFANILSNEIDTELVANEETANLRATIAQLRKDIKTTEHKANIAEDRFNAIGDVVVKLFGDNKRQRIIAARDKWPELPGSAIAIIADSSPAYVSETLKES